MFGMLIVPVSLLYGGQHNKYVNMTLLKNIYRNKNE